MRKNAVIGLVSALVVVVGAGVGAQQNDAPGVEDASIVSVGRLDYYPAIAGSARIQGAVVVAGVLDDRGAVTEAVALSGHTLLASAAVASVRTWTFKPNAQKRFVVVLDFRLEGGCHLPFAQVRLLANLVRVTSCVNVNF